MKPKVFEKNWTMFSNDILTDENLPRNERVEISVLYGTIYNGTQQLGYCSFTQEYLANKLCWGRKKVAKLLKIMEENNYISIESKLFNNKENIKTQSKIFILDKEIPKTKKQNKEKSTYQNDTTPYQNDTTPYQNDTKKEELPYQNDTKKEELPYQNDTKKEELPYQNDTTPYQNDTKIRIKMTRRIKQINKNNKIEILDANLNFENNNIEINNNNMDNKLIEINNNNNMNNQLIEINNNNNMDNKLIENTLIKLFNILKENNKLNINYSNYLPDEELYSKELNDPNYLNLFSKYFKLQFPADEVNNLTRDSKINHTLHIKLKTLFDQVNLSYSKQYNLY